MIGCLQCRKLFPCFLKRSKFTFLFTVKNRIIFSSWVFSNFPTVLKIYESSSGCTTTFNISNQGSKELTHGSVCRKSQSILKWNRKQESYMLVIFPSSTWKRRTSLFCERYDVILVWHFEQLTVLRRLDLKL